MRKFVLSMIVISLCVVQADVFRYLNTARIAYFNEKDYARARRACLEGIEVASDNYELYAILGGSEMGLGDWYAAAQAFEKAFAADTTQTRDWIAGQAEGEKYYFQAFYFSARDLFEQGAYDEALNFLSFDRVMGIEDVNVHVLRGASLYKLDRFDQANEEYAKVLNLEPDNPDINFLIGKSLFDSEEFSGSLTYFETAIDNYSMQYERHGRIIFQNLGGIDSVLAQQIIILWAGKNVDELDQLVKDALGFPEGLAVQGSNIEQFTGLADDLGRSYYFLGMAYYNLKNDTLALKNMIQSVKHKPNDFDGLYFAGEIHVRLQRYAEAIPYLERLTKQSPQDQYGWFYLAVCYTEVKQYGKAVDAYEKRILPLDPDNVDVMNNLAYVYRELGNNEKALYWLIRAEEVKEKTN
ncbi:MAG: tetratricopeptide repeat protein [candidate division WOR-3 bacterium]|jgi:tetratricopeptide (TPR) repeat protein